MRHVWELVVPFFATLTRLDAVTKLCERLQSTLRCLDDQFRDLNRTRSKRMESWTAYWTIRGKPAAAISILLLFL
ncbi:hypothetical protein SISSUDRAFT_1047698 [Sistotremastrum suecicum HHB10207 ss-3]|uniref:Uncharacterized protein n=1 Tax=Sistotremastrum suecicum HHB10207 ss-3 TaxID=1314776 RepID=A0A166CZ63_9AGAM|nr:hypothetical protein SISSUDRAFT_1047698 [Sistotremastrum suecicum HHB10207 ss-3]